MTISPMTGTADPAALLPNPWNTNVVSPDNEAKLEASMRRNGMWKPIVVRELDDGTMQILGGEHRAAIARRIGLKKVMIVSLGRIDDQKAKEIGLLDNSRYGSDDVLQLAALMEGLGGVEELATFMPYTEADLASIFSSVNIALDDLDIPPEDEDAPAMPRERQVQTHQVLKFKVPVDDVGHITDLIEATMKAQGFKEADSLANAGDALVHLFKSLEA